jgi:hypothetical protein
MALTALTYPVEFTPVRDPVWIEYLCGGYEANAPTTASYKLFLTSNPANGYTFELSVNGDTQTFTFVTPPADDSGLQVPIGASSSVTRTNLLAALQGNHAIDQAFALTVDVDDNIVLTARAPGEMTMGFLNTTPVSLSWTVVSNGSDGEYNANYTANHQVWIELVWGSGVFVPLPSHFGLPDSEQRTRWDIRSQLRPYVGYDWPILGSAAASLQRTLQRKFYVAHWESYGDPPAPRLVSRGAVRRAYYAGSRKLERDLLPNLITQFRAGSPSQFMTYRGRSARHEVSANQQHHLAWLRRLPKVTDQQLYMKFTVYYTDNTTDTTTRHTDVNASGWEKDDVKLFPCGFETLALDDLQPTKIPWKYTAEVMSHTDTALSEVHTFHLVDGDSNERHLEYVSSLGVIESIRTVGEWSEGMEAELEPVKRMLTVVNAVKPSLQLSNTVHHLSGAQRKFRVSTGFMQKNELLAIADVLVSPEWRLVHHDRATREPLQLVGGEQRLLLQGHPDEHLYALNLEFLAGDAEMAWSNAVAVPPTEVVADPGGGGEGEEG